jgi:hypothetical protein
MGNILLKVDGTWAALRRLEFLFDERCKIDGAPRHSGIDASAQAAACSLHQPLLKSGRRLFQGVVSLSLQRSAILAPVVLPFILAPRRSKIRLNSGASSQPPRFLGRAFP